MKIGNQVKVIAAPWHLREFIGKIGTIERLPDDDDNLYAVDFGFERPPDFFLGTELELILPDYDPVEFMS